MDRFRRLFTAAAIAGLLAGVFVTLVHQVTTVPVILAAEVYEKAAEPPATGGLPVPAATAAMSGMSSAEMNAMPAVHDHGSAWEPKDGLERTAFTALADILTGIGFALLLVAIYALWGGKVDSRKGLYFGLAAFAAVTLAPSLGLPPEVPGTEAAPLLARQIWWVATAGLTGGGLALLFLTRRPLLMAVGVAMIVLPHAYGAPQPAEYASAAPEMLAHRFIVAVTITSLLFWAALGTLSGFFYQRFCTRAPAA
jgi:cobalt transporter subunit CbtA